ncbi:hypothetical protein [Nocardia wallacei]|uniref:hypothetical protein n=1 Tax=Nocardia wallacei TaxID=480035 RepID=UPI002458CA27|nr:hypothetical protein [Nocardia wallacei]
MNITFVRPTEVHTRRIPVNRLIGDGGEPILIEIGTEERDGRECVVSALVEQFELNREHDVDGKPRVKVTFVDQGIEPRFYAPEDEIVTHRVKFLVH